MNFFVQNLIINTVTFAVTTSIPNIQTKQNNNILFLRKLIKKSFLLKNFSSAMLFSNLNATFKAPFSANILLKTLNKK